MYDLDAEHPRVMTQEMFDRGLTHTEALCLLDSGQQYCDDEFIWPDDMDETFDIFKSASV